MGVWCKRLAQLPHKQYGSGSSPAAPTSFFHSDGCVSCAALGERRSFPSLLKAPLSYIEILLSGHRKSRFGRVGGGRNGLRVRRF